MSNKQSPSQQTWESEREGNLCIERIRISPEEGFHDVFKRILLLLLDTEIRIISRQTRRPLFKTPYNESDISWPVGRHESNP